MSKKLILNQVLLSLISFIFSQLILALILNYLNFNYFSTSNWLRADSGHYLQIANSGYEFFPCAGYLYFPPDSKDFCGNTGWYPGYPLLIRTFRLIYDNPYIIAVLISKIFYFLTLLIAVKVLHLNKFSLKNILLIIIAGISVGFIYYNGIFPISALVFFVVSGIYFMLSQKIFIAGLFCFLASFFYPTGFLLSFVFALYILITDKEQINQKLKKMMLPLILGGLGVFSVLLILQLTVNDWTAFFKVQAKYGHHFHNPVTNIVLFFENGMIKKQNLINNFIYYQSLLIFIGYIVASFFFFKQKMYKNNLYLISYIYISIFLIFPWCIAGDLSRYRSESLLFPYVFLLKKTKNIFLIIILLVLLIIGIPMSYLFFADILV